MHFCQDEFVALFGSDGFAAVRYVATRIYLVFQQIRSRFK